MRYQHIAATNWATEANKYFMIDPTEDDFMSLYMHSKQPYKQKMFTCMPAEFVVDPHPPQDKDFRETNLERITLPLPSVKD